MYIFIFVTNVWHKLTVINALKACSRNQHNDTQHNDTQHNDTQHNDIQHKGLICDTRHNDTEHKLNLSLC